MSLLAALKLTPPKNSGKGAGAKSGAGQHAPAASSSAGGGQAGKGKADDPNDDVGDGDFAVAAQKPLGHIAFERHRATIWAMTDTAGGVANGTGSRAQGHLGQLNKLGTMLISAVGEMNSMEADWHQKVDVVRKATAKSAIDIQKVVAELPAMRERRKADDTFSKDIKLYLDGLDRAEAAIQKIRSAEQGLAQASANLKKDELWKSASDKTEEVAKDQDAVDAKKAEIAEAKRVAGEIFDIAEKVIKQDWSGLASKAMEFAKGKVIDAIVDDAYGKELDDLQKKLTAAQTDLKNLKNAALAAAIEASRAGVSKALTDLGIAKTAFGVEIGHLEELQTAASDMLGRSKNTAAVGVMLSQRTEQIHAIDVARTACERYNRVCDTTRSRLRLVSREYGSFGSWLNDAEKIDSQFDRAQGYAKILEMSALSNAVECGRWDDWLNGVVGQSKKAIAWLADSGANGPMVHFALAMKTARDALVNAHPSDDAAIPLKKKK